MNDYTDFYLFDGAYYGALHMVQNNSCDFSLLTSAVFFMEKKMLNADIVFWDVISTMMLRWRLYPRGPQWRKDD